jgi:hypothetical protein
MFDAYGEVIVDVFAIPCSLDADRAPQLKAGVGLLSLCS